MSQRPLPTAWNVYNLTGSPFFQQPLESGDRTPRPLSLFVGRRTELARLTQAIFGAGDNASIQAIGGAPGVGKTTLVKELKALALAKGYMTTDAYVAILPEDTTESMFGRVLSLLYETILANRPQSGGNPAMADAKLLVRTTRLTSAGVTLPIPGIGGLGMSRGGSITTPKDIMLDGPRIMRNLADMVLGSDARGLLLHLDNLENLSESSATRAADVLRALRDVMLLHNGLHYVILGTSDAINSAVNAHAQIRSVVSSLVLAPLSVSDVHDLLQARYEHLRADPDRPVMQPVNRAAVAKLYGIFRGDLRGFLKALEDGTSLIGLDEATGRSLTFTDLEPVLRQRYERELSELPEQVRTKQLTRWGTKARDISQTQDSLGKLWGISQPSVSTALAYLMRQGYVVALPRAGREPIEYVLSGVSRLIFG